MGDNQNRGSGDFRRNQAGRKRREPPTIDATATEVPITPSPPEPTETDMSAFDRMDSMEGSAAAPATGVRRYHGGTRHRGLGRRCVGHPRPSGARQPGRRAWHALVSRHAGH